jgi:hypothetical protein
MDHAARQIEDAVIDAALVQADGSIAADHELRPASVMEVGLGGFDGLEGRVEVESVRGALEAVLGGGARGAAAGAAAEREPTVT